MSICIFSQILKRSFYLTIYLNTIFLCINLTINVNSNTICRTIFFTKNSTSIVKIISAIISPSCHKV